MKFDHINRRTHLYLGLFLLPWFFMYGISSLPFAHHDYFNGLYDDGVPEWTVRFERAYDRPVPSAGDLRDWSADVLTDADVHPAAFGAYRPPNRNDVEIYSWDFWSATRLIYSPDKHSLRVEDRRFRWDHFLTGMHARGGFQQASFLNDAWAVLVDAVMVAILLWIATGLIMWWRLRGSRGWGLLAIGTGVAAFAVFVATL